MLYSSCKGPLISSLEQEFGFEFAKKVRAPLVYTRVADLSELTLPDGDW